MRVGTGQNWAIAVMLGVFSLSLVAAVALAGDDAELRRFQEFSTTEQPAESGPVCEVQAAGGRPNVAELDVAQLQQAIEAQIAPEMKPGVPGVWVDADTVVLNGRGYNYVPTRKE